MAGRHSVTAHHGADAAARGVDMLIWAMISLALAIATAVLGFGGRNETSGGLAETLFYGFLALAITTLAAGFTDRHSGRRSTP
jgi:uncharacterized membrane protein YtjA (UPF0391 family)